MAVAKSDAAPAYFKESDLEPVRAFREEVQLYRAYLHGGQRLPSWNPWHLRYIAERTGPIVLGKQLRHRQIKPYCRPSHDEDLPGYKVSLADHEAKPTAADKKEIKRLEEWFQHGGERYPGWHLHREHGFTDLHTMIMCNWFYLDSAFLEVRRNRKGDPIEPALLDPATMRRVAEGGWDGSMHDFRPDLLIYPNQEFSRWVADWRKKEIRNIDPREIKYVQVRYDMMPNMAYTSENLLWMHLNPRTDPRWYGLGHSPIEMMIQIISGWLNSFTYHVENSSSASVPPIALVTENHMTSQQMAALSEKATARFNGPRGQQKIPVLSSGKWSKLDLRSGPRDREYQWFLQFLMQLIGGIYGVDFAEVGFKLQQQSTLAQGGHKDQQKASKSLGLQDLLHSFERLWTRWLVQVMDRPEFVFRYTGDRPEDQKLMSELRKAAVETYRTPNELRAEEDLKPIDGGDIILNQVYLQGKQADQQAEMMGGMGDDADIDSAVDQAFAEAV